MHHLFHLVTFGSMYGFKSLTQLCTYYTHCSSWKKWRISFTRQHYFTSALSFRASDGLSVYDDRIYSPVQIYTFISNRFCIADQENIINLSFFLFEQYCIAWYLESFKDITIVIQYRQLPLPPIFSKWYYHWRRWHKDHRNFFLFPQSSNNQQQKS